MSRKLFCDVDGVINLSPKVSGGFYLSPIETATVTRLMAPNIHGFRAGIEEVITWSQETIDFIKRCMRHGAELWWVTGWRSNAPLALDPLFGFESSGWIDWDIGGDPSERGKFIAINQFLEQNPTEEIMWIDDVATQHALSSTSRLLSRRQCIIQTTPTRGLTGEALNAAKSFWFPTPTN